MGLTWHVRAQGQKQAMPFLYVRGRTIRYVHLPGSLDPAQLLDSHRRRIRDAVAANRKDMLAQHSQVRLPKGLQDDGAAVRQQSAMEVEQA